MKLVRDVRRHKTCLCQIAINRLSPVEIHVNNKPTTSYDFGVIPQSHGAMRNAVSEKDCLEGSTLVKTADGAVDPSTFRGYRSEVAIEFLRVVRGERRDPDLSESSLTI